MEMNRYLIAALYVMAGCVVAIPLKVQVNTEPLRGDRCRLAITNTVKVISVCMDDRETDSFSCDLPDDYYSCPEICCCDAGISFGGCDVLAYGMLYYTSHKIRAPEA